MAFPVITFDRDAGSDTNDASGAGPATAIVGIKARTRGAGGTRIGFFETSNPNLSGIAVDGSNALKLGTSSGRQWTKITAKKDMAQAFTADAAASSDTLTNVSSQAGLTIGDVIKVPGAGAASADLYVTILDLPTSTSIQMNTTASTNQTTAACVDPKQVTVEDSFTLTSDIAWACGGKRGDLAAATQLGADLKGGWTLALDRGAAGQVYEDAATFLLMASGDTTNGRINIIGLKYDGVRPTLKITGGGAAFFTLRNDLYHFSGFDCADMTALVLVDNNAVQDVMIDDMETDGSSGDLIKYTAAVLSGRCALRGSDVLNVSSAVKVEGTLNLVLVEASFFSHVGVGTMVPVKITGRAPVVFRQNVCDTVLDGVELGSAAGQGAPSIVDGNVFRNTVHDCLHAGHLDHCRGLVFRNNVCEAQLYHVDLPAGGGGLVDVVDYNCHVDSVKLNNVVQGAHDVVRTTAQSLQFFRDAPAADFRPTLALRALGWPTRIGLGPTTSWVDLGAAQRREAVGGEIPGEVLLVSDLGDEYELKIEVLGGGLGEVGAIYAVTIPKVSLPYGEPNKPEVAASVAALIDQEVLA